MLPFFEEWNQNGLCDWNIDQDDTRMVHRLPGQRMWCCGRRSVEITWKKAWPACNLFFAPYTTCIWTRSLPQARRSHAVNSAAIATFAQFLSRTLITVRCLPFRNLWRWLFSHLGCSKLSHLCLTAHTDRYYSVDIAEVSLGGPSPSTTCVHFVPSYPETSIPKAGIVEKRVLTAWIVYCEVQQPLTPKAIVDGVHALVIMT